MSPRTTCRPRKAILYQGLFYAVLFLGATVGYASLFFLDNPARQGFKGGWNAATLGGAGIAVFGLMFVLSLYTILTYYVERFAVDGSTFFVRSVFQNRQFDRTEIQSVQWKTSPNGGNLRFRAFGRTARLDLHGFDREDRLQIIRIVREMVPVTNQKGWNKFCHHIALPLRDDTSAMERVDDSIETVLVTRRRYDRLVCLLLPLSIVVAVLLWWWTALPQFFVLPPSVVGFWLLLRFSIRKEGSRTQRLTSHPAGRAQLAAWIAIALTQLLMVVLLVAGAGKNLVCTIGLVFLLVGMIPMFIWLLRASKQQKAADQRGAETADAEWQRGEADHPQLS